MNPLPSKTLGERIRELRTARQQSMRELAAKAKLRSPAFIADLEKGFRNPSPEVLSHLAEALNVPVQDLRLHDRRAPLQEIREITEKNQAWAHALRKLVDQAQAGVLTPASLTKLLEGGGTDNSAQSSLPLWA